MLDRENDTPQVCQNKTIKLRNHFALERAFPALNEAINIIERYSATGAALMDWARTQKIYIGKNEDENGNEKANCQCLPDQTALISVYAEDTAFHPFLMAHELFHAVQHIEHNAVNGIFNLAHNLSIIASSTFILEAAANAFAAKILFEMKQNGYSAPFDTMRAGHDGYQRYQKIFIAYERSYERHIKEGYAPELAADAACKAAYQHWFIHENMETYTQGKALPYINMLLKKHINPHEPKNKMRASFYRAACQSHDGAPLFTPPADPPTLTGLFNGHTKLRQLCDVIDHAHLVRAARMDSSDVPANIQRLKEDQNPYIKLSLHRFYEMLNSHNEKDQSPPTFMDAASQLVGLDDHTQYQMDFGSPKPSFMRR